MAHENQMELKRLDVDKREAEVESGSDNSSSTSGTNSPELFQTPNLFCRGLYALVPTVITACLMSLLGGTTLSYSSATLLELKELANPLLRFDSTLLSDIFGSSAMVGSILGGPIAGFIADRWGRLNCLTLNVLPYLVGYFTILSTYLLQHPASFKVVLILGRGITGIGLGWSFTIVPIYIGEITPARLRGMFISFADIFLSIGILSSYGLGTVPQLHYYDTVLVFLGVMVIFMTLALWLLETPRWLILKRDDIDTATKIMHRFRSHNKANEVKVEVENIRSSASGKNSSFTQTLHKMFCAKPTLVPFLISLFVCTYHQLSGVGIITTYTGQILQAAQVPNPNLVSFCTAGLGLLLGRITAGILVELVGRKILYALSSTGICVSHIILGIHFYLTNPSVCSGSIGQCKSHLFPMAVVGILLFAISFGIGVGPITWILVSEYLPLEIKGIAGGICVLGNRIVAVVLTGTFLSYSKYAGSWAPFLTLTIINVIGLVIIIVFVAETKGKTLEEVQELYQKRTIQISCKR